MSSVYVVEPPTKGKVVVKTTMGPLDIELWPKEAPKAVRNFVQLCLEGYFDRTIFHRVIASFLVQAGDPTGSGTGGESIYGEPFKDEFHTRLRFSHRGIVACANAGSPHSNGSQFFFTLDRCEWLDRKNTIFGKVTGDSIYNLLKLGDTETDKDDRPLEPPKIISVEVLWNPFEDIVPRQVLQKPLPNIEEQGQKKKGVKKLSVLSFGEEVEEEEKELATTREKIKSIHDALDDPRFLKEPQKEELNPEEIQRKKDAQRAVREALSSKKVDFYKERENDNSDTDNWDDDESKFDERMRMRIMRKRREMDDIPREKLASGKLNQQNDMSSPRSDAEDTIDRASKVEKLSIKKKGIGSEARAERMAKADVDLQLLGHAEQERQLKKQKKRRLHGREENTLEKLERFKKSLSTKLSAPSAPDNSKSVGNDDDEVDESGWLTNRLTFTSEGKNGMNRKEDPNDYVVHDPLLEKGKEKFNKMQAKLKRREREWAGKSIT